MTSFKPIFGLGIVILLIFASCDSRSSTAGAGTDIVGEIVHLEGDVTVNSQAASVGDEVVDGDVLVTAPGAYAEVVFGDYRVLRANENAVLTLSASEDTLKLDQGALAVVQSKARFFSRDKPWEVKTPTTVAAVRGTVYYVKVEDPDTTYFCLCNGKIHLEDTQDGRGIDLETNHHNAIRFFREGDRIAYRDAPMLYHLDEEMESLADLVDVSIDWNEIH